MSSTPKELDERGVDCTVDGPPPPRRRDGEAPSISTAPEDGAENELSLNPTAPSEYEFSILRAGGTGDRCLVPSTESQQPRAPAYYIRNSIFRPGIPDVTIFAGGDATGRVVGVCMYAAFSGSIHVGRGDPAATGPDTHPNDVEWETVSKTSRDHSTYRFSIVSPRTGERKAYIWKRTHDPEIKGTESSKLDRRSWKLVDDATGRVVAVLASNGIKSWKKAGTFRFLGAGEEGKEWEEWILLTCFGLFEKARRRAMARRDLSWFI